MTRQRQANYQKAEGDAVAPTLLDCPVCRSFISEKDLNKKTGIAKCNHCDHVFSYEEDGYWDPFGLPAETQPSGLEVLRLPSFTEMHIRHVSSKPLADKGFLIFFTLMWNVMLIPFIYNIIQSGELFPLAFISLHLFAGVSMLWNLLGTLFNQTSVEVSERALIVRTTPFVLPSKREVEIPASDLSQLYVSRSKTKKKGPNSASGLSLYALTESGKKHLLLSGLDRRTLHFIEHEVERYLDIEDRVVRG